MYRATLEEATLEEHVPGGPGMSIQGFNQKKRSEQTIEQANEINEATKEQVKQPNKKREQPNEMTKPNEASNRKKANKPR